MKNRHLYINLYNIYPSLSFPLLEDYDLLHSEVRVPKLTVSV